ncbi:unnamed protein product [Prorocentrum cordatum]|uniref:Uncharacterized protein n=1 Tax=Prorocentrum cordatum TaxID=2364126 RepID=A0ABN9UEJ5_9DINO|nr:unnamed protein product [Polarella glacialis]
MVCDDWTSCPRDANTPCTTMEEERADRDRDGHAAPGNYPTRGRGGRERRPAWPGVAPAPLGRGRHMRSTCAYSRTRGTRQWDRPQACTGGRPRSGAYADVLVAAPTPVGVVGRQPLPAPLGGASGQPGGGGRDPDAPVLDSRAAVGVVAVVLLAELLAAGAARERQEVLPPAGGLRTAGARVAELGHEAKMRRKRRRRRRRSEGREREGRGGQDGPKTSLNPTGIPPKSKVCRLRGVEHRGKRTAMGMGAGCRTLGGKLPFGQGPSSDSTHP